jgi:enoyl reductase
MRAVQYKHHGGPEVLEIVEVPEPLAGPGALRVRVITTGVNPFDAKVMQGMITMSGAAAALPSGIGSDFAGVVDVVGDGVDPAWIGREVLGQASFSAHGDVVVVPADRVIERPVDLDWVRAGALGVVATTAIASVASLRLGPDDTVLVSAAAGGVGVLASQLALRTGARVIGTAGAENHEFLRELGVEPVEYGDGLVAAVRAIAPEGITAALDNHGRASVLAALELGAPASRVNSIADYAGPAELGISAVGGAAFADPAALREVAGLIADGEMAFPIEIVLPLERVQEVYERLLHGHLRGKIVLQVAPPPA